MKEIKIGIVDWWNQDFEKNYFVRFLSKRYKVIRSKKPDFLLCSRFGLDHLKFDCTKIFFTGENLTPDFNLYDYALGFDPIEFGDRYLRYPLFLLCESSLKKAQTKHIFDPQAMLNRGFCSFVVSNGKNADPIREVFFDAMSEIGFVASGGGFRNNIGTRVEDKDAFLRQHKFNIAFENSQSDGYCTEKLIEAFAAQTIPIYWGDLSLTSMGGGGRDFINPKSYINLSTFATIQEALEYICEIKNDDKLYLEILQEPAFLRSDIREYYEAKLEKFFEEIFANPRRVVLSEARRHYQRTQKKLLYVRNLSHPVRYLKNLLNER